MCRYNHPCLRYLQSLFFFNDTPPTDIYTLSLHDALPISRKSPKFSSPWVPTSPWSSTNASKLLRLAKRSEEHTSELQSLTNLVCRLLLEKKKNRDRRRQELDH